MPSLVVTELGADHGRARIRSVDVMPQSRARGRWRKCAISSTGIDGGGAGSADGRADERRQQDRPVTCRLQSRRAEASGRMALRPSVSMRRTARRSQQCWRPFPPSCAPGPRCRPPCWVDGLRPLRCARTVAGRDQGDMSRVRRTALQHAASGRTWSSTGPGRLEQIHQPVEHVALDFGHCAGEADHSRPISPSPADTVSASTDGGELFAGK